MTPGSRPPAGGSSPALARARRCGPIPYSALGRPARAPAPPGLGLWLAGNLDRWWEQLGEPDPYVVVEVGAGDGRRASEMLAVPPACAPALRYVLVEDDPAFASRQARHVRLVPPAFVLGPVVSPGPDVEPVPRRGVGPLTTSLGELPAAGGTGVVLAVGWLSCMPADRLLFRDGRWWELRLAASGDSLVELPVPLSEEAASRVDRLVTRPRPEGACYAWQDAASAWLADARAILEGGKLVVVDRCSPLTLPASPGGAPGLALDQLTRLGGPSEARWGDPFPWSTLVWEVGSGG